jgi:hypothetical protein
MKFFPVILILLIVILLLMILTLKGLELFNPNDSGSITYTVPVYIKNLNVTDINSPEINDMTHKIDIINANLDTITANLESTQANITNPNINKLDNYEVTFNKDIDIGTIKCSTIDNKHTLENCAKECSYINDQIGSNYCLGFNVSKNLDDAKCCLKNINSFNKIPSDSSNTDYYKNKNFKIPKKLQNYSIYFNRHDNNTEHTIGEPKILDNTYTLLSCSNECSNNINCGAFIHNKNNNTCILKDLTSIISPPEKKKNYDYYYKEDNNQLTCDKNSKDKCIFRYYNYNIETDPCEGPTETQKYNNNDIRKLTNDEFQSWLKKKYINNIGEYKTDLFKDKELINEYMRRCNYQVPDIISNKVNGKWYCFDNIRSPVRYNKEGNIDCISYDGVKCDTTDTCQSKLLNINSLDDNKILECKDLDYKDKDSICSKAKTNLVEIKKINNTNCMVNKIINTKTSTTNDTYVGDFNSFDDCVNNIRNKNEIDKINSITWFNNFHPLYKNQCYTSKSSISRSIDNNVTCGIKQKKPQQFLSEGSTVVCDNKTQSPLNTYRYTNNELRPYGTVEIANSWDPQWNTKQGLIDCNNITIGPNMVKKI